MTPPHWTRPGERQPEVRAFHGAGEINPQLLLAPHAHGEVASSSLEAILQQRGAGAGCWDGGTLGAGVDGKGDPRPAYGGLTAPATGPGQCFHPVSTPGLCCFNSTWDWGGGRQIWVPWVDGPLTLVTGEEFLTSKETGSWFPLRLLGE